MNARWKRRTIHCLVLTCFLAAAAWNLFRAPTLMSLDDDTRTPQTLETRRHSNKPETLVVDSSSQQHYTLWSSDFHIAPIADVKDLFHRWSFNHDIIDQSLSGECNTTCATNLQVINKTNGLSLGPCPNQLKRDFWNVYRDDPVMNTVDAFFCHHAVGMCEVFMAFGRPMIIVVSTRYEIGRRTPEAWIRLNENLRAIATNPRNTIVANNRYDAEYLRHFSGLDVKVLPNYCGYTNAMYNPNRPQILIGPGRLSFGAELLVSGAKGIVQAAASSTRLRDTNYKEFVPIRKLYKHYSYEDLASHPAIVLIPYQVSIMSITEYYRMGIPLFAPSPDLLTKWQEKATVVSEISWNCVYGRCRDKSQIPADPNSPHGNKDPNDMRNFRYWVEFADFYQLPHIVLFDSWDDLFEKLVSTNLNDVHTKMVEYNKQLEKDLRNEWLDKLERAFEGVPPRSSHTSANEAVWGDTRTWEEAMLAHYPSFSEQVSSAC